MMKIRVGFALAWLCAGLGSGVLAESILLDWGVIEPTSAEQQGKSRLVKDGSAKIVQRVSARGRTPWLVQFSGVVQPEWREALEATGAEIKGYVPENAFLLQATAEQLADIGALPEVVWVGEFLPEYKRAAPVRKLLAKGGAGDPANMSSSCSMPATACGSRAKLPKCAMPTFPSSRKHPTARSSAPPSPPNPSRKFPAGRRCSGLSPYTRACSSTMSRCRHPG